MRAAAGLVAMLLFQVAVGGAAGPGVAMQHIRYERAVVLPVGMSGQACAVLDGDVFAHAANASLPDVRLVSGGVEVPLAVTESGTEREESEAAEVHDAGKRGSDIVFGMTMPKRPYTAVVLDLDAKDFAGTAHVFGVGNDGAKTDLGTFAVFDLSGQGLSRSTTLSLQEASFPELEMVLHLGAVPGTAAREFGASVVKGANIPPSREAQELFTTVAETASVEHRGGKMIALLHLPAHVPVERTRFTIEPQYQRNFLRGVKIVAIPQVKLGWSYEALPVEIVRGSLSHVKLVATSDTGNLPIDESQLSVDSVLGANLREGATIDVEIVDGTERPLPVTAVRLEMRQRKICFDAAANAGPYLLMYGDETLRTPRYPYAQSFVPATAAIAAVLGAEALNPSFVARQDARTYVERHPELVWVGLLVVIGIVGSMVLRGARRRH